MFSRTPATSKKSWIHRNVNELQTFPSIYVLIYENLHHWREFHFYFCWRLLNKVEQEKKMKVCMATKNDMPVIFLVVEFHEE